MVSDTFEYNLDRISVIDQKKNWTKEDEEEINARQELISRYNHVLNDMDHLTKKLGQKGGSVD